MAQSVGGVYIPLDLETGKFNSRLTEADRRITAFGRSANTALSSLSALGKISLAGGIFGVGAAGLLAQAVKINTELADMAKLAREAGLSFSKIQEIKFAALTGGVSESGFASGLQSIAKLIEESARQETTLSKLFAANNIALKDRHGQLISVNEALARGADLISRAGSGAAKTQIADMLGLSREWVRALEGGGAAFLKTASEARAAGAVMSSDLIARAEVFEREWTKATAKWKLGLQAAAAELLPDLVKLANVAISVAESVGKKIGQASLAARMEQGLPLDIRHLEALEDAVQKLRNAGEIVDPSWLKELERLRAEAAAAKKEITDLTITAPASGPKTVLPSNDSTRPKGFDSILVSGQNKVTSLRAEAAAIGLTAGAAAKLRLETDLLNAANRQGITLSESQRQQLSAIAEEYSNVASRIEFLNGPMLSAARSAIDLNTNLQNIAVSGVDQLANSIDDVASGSKKAEEAFADMAKSILNDLRRMLIKAALWKAVSGFMGMGGGGISAYSGFGNPWSAGGMIASARGNVFGPSGKITAFARGGVVKAPTVFPFATGIGLMGEAGPEAIMPLTRGPGGKLGVHAVGGGAGSNVRIVVENKAPNVAVRDGGTSREGNVDVKRLIIEAVAGEIGSGKSPINQAMEGRYGLDRTRGMS